MEWQQVHLFISSTFRDMYYEREYLVKDVLLELKSWCLERRLILSEIDLRWGVTEYMAKEQRLTIYKCLRGVDASRPFFLCLLGQYRGWKPELSDMPSPTIESYPALAAMAGKNSATEMEIQHAISGNEAQPACDAVFFRRTLTNIPESLRTIYTNESVADRTQRELDDEALHVLAEETLPAYGYKPISYTPSIEGEVLTDFCCDGIPLAETLLPLLKAAILRRYPDREHSPRIPPERVWLDRQQQRLYLLQLECADGDELKKESTRLDIPMDANTPDERTLLEEHWAFAKGHVLITGEAGSGRSTLLAHWIGKQHPEALYCFCRKGDSLKETLLQLLNAAQEDVPSPDEPLGMLINRMTSLCQRRECPLAIDGLEYFAPLESTQLLGAAGLRILATVRSDCAQGTLLLSWATAHDVAVFQMNPLRDTSRRKLAVALYLERYLKSLDDKQMELLFTKPSASNPLFLHIVLSELRIFGSFEDLNRQLDGFGSDVQSAFHAVLARLENDYETTAVGRELPSRVFSLLAASQNGLTLSEWRGALHALTDPLAIILRQIEPFIGRYLEGCETVFDFGFESFRNAASIRYNDRLSDAHEALYSVFEDAVGGNRFCSGSLRDYEQLFYHAQKTHREPFLVSSLKYQHERIKRGGLSGLIRDLMAVNAPQSAAFLQQHAGSLIAQPDSLLSLLLYEGGTLRETALLQAITWDEPYLDTSEINLTAPVVADHASGEKADIRAALELSSVYASDLALPGNFIFRSERSGEIAIYDGAQTALPPMSFPVEKGRVLRICVSGDASYLTVAYESGKILVYSLRFENRKLSWTDCIYTGAYLLPEADDPALDWQDGAFYWQRADGAVVRLHFEDGRERVIFEERSCELALLAPGLYAFRADNAMLLCTEDAKRTFPYAATASCRTESQYAVAFADGSVYFLNTHTLETEQVLPKQLSVKSMAWQSGTLYLVVRTDGAEATDGFFAFDCIAGLREIHCSEPLYPNHLLQRMARVGFDAQGNFTSLSNLRYYRVALGGECETAQIQPVIETACTAGGRVLAVFRSDDKLYLSDAERIYHSLNIGRTRLNWAISGEAAVGISRSANDPICRISLTDAAWYETGRTMASVAGGRALWLLDDQSNLYRMEADGSLRRIPGIEKLRAQNIACYGEYIVLTLLDTAQPVIGPRLHIFYSDGNQLQKLAELFFPADEGHYQCSVVDAESGMLYLFSADKQHPVNLRRINIATRVSESGDIPLPFLRNISQVCLCKGTLYVREGDGALTAMTTEGKRICGMQPLAGADHLLGDETVLFFTRNKLWCIQAVNGKSQKTD